MFVDSAIQTVRRIQNTEWTRDDIMAVDRESWQWPLNFMRTRSGQSITLSILTSAKTEGYATTLDYPYRTDWFEKMFETWYQPLGLLGRFKVVKPKDLRLKFKKCENDARRIYESRVHQSDTTGALDETNMPLYYKGFRYYFDHSEAPASDRARLRMQ